MLVELVECGVFFVESVDSRSGSILLIIRMKTIMINEWMAWQSVEINFQTVTDWSSSKVGSDKAFGMTW
jgi:hypothetical protein